MSWFDDCAKLVKIPDEEVPYWPAVEKSSLQELVQWLSENDKAKELIPRAHHAGVHLLCSLHRPPSNTRYAVMLGEKPRTNWVVPVSEGDSVRFVDEYVHHCHLAFQHLDFKDAVEHLTALCTTDRPPEDKKDTGSTKDHAENESEEKPSTQRTVEATAVVETTASKPAVPKPLKRRVSDYPPEKETSTKRLKKSVTKAPKAKQQKTPKAVSRVSAFETPEATARTTQAEMAPATKSVQRTKPPKSSSSSKSKVGSLVITDEKPPTFKDVRPILVRAGYRFTSNKFQCPSGASFATAEELRANLCAFGIEGKFNTISDDDRELVSLWVRYHIVRSIDLDKGMPSDAHLPTKLLTLSTLFRIGFSYKTKLANRYIALPGVTVRDLRPGENAFNESDERSLYTFLARVGLPDNCDFSAISDAQLVALELMLCEPSIGFGFEIVPKRERSRYLEYMRFGPPMEANDSDVPVDTDPFELSFSPAARLVSDESTGGFPSQESPMKLTPPSSPSRIVDEEGAGLFSPEISPMQRTESAVDKLLALASAQKRACLPDRKRLSRSKLEACLEALGPKGATGGIALVHDGNYAKSLAEVYTFLSAVVTSEGANGGCDFDPPALYVCGGPGTGKTSGVTWCCEEVIREKARSLKKGQSKPVYAVMNAANISSGKQLWTGIGRAFGLANTSPENVKKFLSRGQSEYPKIKLLVIDEIDQLVCSPATGRSPTAPALKELFDLSRSGQGGFGLVGVSNAIVNQNYALLQELGQVSIDCYTPDPLSTTLTRRQFKERLIFQYNVNDLKGILATRVGTKVVPEKVQEFIAKRVINAGSDARKALELCAMAVKLALAELSVGDEGSSDQDDLVSLRHVTKAAKASDYAMSDRIKSLPKAAQVALCVLLTLSEASVEKIDIRTLSALVSDCLISNYMNDVLTAVDFNPLLEMLVDTGILCISAQGKGGSGDFLDRDVCLGVQYSEVMKAVDANLYKLEFFRGIRDRALDRKDLI